MKTLIGHLYPEIVFYCLNPFHLFINESTAAQQKELDCRTGCFYEKLFCEWQLATMYIRWATGLSGQEILQKVFLRIYSCRKEDESKCYLCLLILK